AGASAVAVSEASAAARAAASAAGAARTAAGADLGNVVGVEHGAAREADLAHAVHVDALHLDFVAEVHDVLDLFDALGVHLADVQEAVLAGEDFDERAEVRDARDLALVDA